MNLLKDQRGYSAISAIILGICILIVAGGFYEVIRVNITIVNVRDALQTAVIDTCTENYADIYNGTREGYSGGYQLSGEDWVETLATSDIYNKMNESLGMQNQVRYAGNSIDYKVYNLAAQITNAPFAPEDPEEQNKLTCLASIDLEIPLFFDWANTNPMKFNLEVKAGYRPKF